MKTLAAFAFILLISCAVVLPVNAQSTSPEDSKGRLYWIGLGLSIMGLGVAAAGCGLAQSNALKGAASGISRNPGTSSDIRALTFIGLGLIEFLTLITFVGVIWLFT